MIYFLHGFDLGILSGTIVFLCGWRHLGFSHFHRLSCFNGSDSRDVFDQVVFHSSFWQLDWLSSFS